jgi:hypothetical protein
MLSGMLVTGGGPARERIIRPFHKAKGRTLGGVRPGLAKVEPELNQ